MGRKPVVRVMHGSARGEALHATSIGRAILQWGVYLQELLTAFLSPSTVVGVSANTQRDNPFVRRIIPHGVDTAIFQPLPIGKSPHPSIVFVGAVDGRKRGGFLLDIFERVIRPAYPDAELTFVGPKGPSQPGVTYVTGVPDKDLAALYRRAWVCAAPSTYEGFGLPYLEAMACGTAVIATPNPGSREVLGEDYSGLVEDARVCAGTHEAAGGRGQAARARDRRHPPRRGVLHRPYDRSVRSALERFARFACAINRFSLARLFFRRRSTSRSTRQCEEGAAVPHVPWGWLELFVLVQVLWGVLLFVPGSQALPLLYSSVSVRGQPRCARRVHAIQPERTAERPARDGFSRRSHSWSPASFTRRPGSCRASRRSFFS